MLLTADPEVQLRFEYRRSVFNGIFLDQANLATDDVHERLSQHVCRRHPHLATGNVDVSATRYAASVRAEERSLLGKLSEHMQSYGFVNDDAQVSDMDRNTTYMASRGAIPHADCYNSEWYDTLFWVYVLESNEADLVFANIGLRFALKPGQLVVFDPAQPHGVLASESKVFRHCDFPAARRQSYLAGHITYGPHFWQTLGESTDAKVLGDSDLQDIRIQHIDKRTGRIKPRLR